MKPVYLPKSSVFFFQKWRNTGQSSNFTLSPLSVECDFLWSDAVLTFESQRVMYSSERHQNVRPTLKATGWVNGTGSRMCLYMCLALHLASGEPCQNPRHSFLTLILFLFHSWITRNGSTSVHGRNVPCISWTFWVLSAATVYLSAMLSSLIYRYQYCGGGR